MKKYLKEYIKRLLIGLGVCLSFISIVMYFSDRQLEDYEKWIIAVVGAGIIVFGFAHKWLFEKGGDCEL